MAAVTALDLPPGLIPAVVAFTVSNVDSAALLLAMFGAAQTSRTPVAPVAVGQFVALELLAVLSLAGAGALSELGRWFALLGIVPLLIGLHRLAQAYRHRSEPTVAPDPDPTGSGWAVGRGAGVFAGVMAVMLLSGADNIGVYVPLFRDASTESLWVSMTVFVVLDLLMCLVTWRLAYSALFSRLLDRVASWLVPFVLITIGVVVLTSN